MEFWDVIRHRHMTRNFDGQPVPTEVIERIIEAGRRAPSAGFTQGTSFLVLHQPEDTKAFWEAITREGDPPSPGGRWSGMRRAGAVVVPLADKQAYLDRYAEPDKAGLGMGVESGWPAPYWEIDAAFAAMAMLLAATAEGVGALFFAVPNPAALATAFGLPDRLRPIGAIAFGHPAEAQVRSPSLARGRKPAEATVRWGRWEWRSDH